MSMASASMAAANPAQRRRKAATYGKPTRRPFYDFENDFGTGATPTARTHWLPGRENQRPLAREESLAPNVEPGSASSRPSPSISTRSDTPSISRSGIATSSQSKGVHSRENDSEQTTVFDVPASDDDALPNPKIHSRPRSQTVKRLGFKRSHESRPAPDAMVKGGFEPETVENGRKRRRPTPASIDESIKGKDGQQSMVGRPRYNKTKDAPRQLSADVTSRQETNNGTAVNAKESRVRSSGQQHVMLDKPRHTRLRTNPGRPAIYNAQSTPADVRSMLAASREHLEQGSYPSPLPSGTSSPNEEERMICEESDPLTPPQADSRSIAVLSSSGSATPKQKQIWSNLLGNSGNAQSPSTIQLDKLRISEQSLSAKQTSLSRSVSDIPIHTSRRTRLIDTLIQSTPSANDEGSASEEDQDFPVAANGQNIVSTGTESHQRSIGAQSAIQGNDLAVDLQSSFGSQGSQTAARSTGGPKVTYARQRSYLDESTLETELLFSMPLESTSPYSRHSKAQGKVVPAFRKPPAFDEDMEDLDDGTKTIKSIHELRAAGGSKRLADDIWALVQDIKDRSASARSSRRSAMLELASKCEDRAFVGRMVDNGLDRSLFSNLPTASDTIFDFSLAAATAFIVRTGSSVAVLETILSSGVLRIFTSLLNHDSDITTIAKDRRTNMSKVAQGFVADLRKLLQESTLWEDTPDTISPRLMAMRAMEMLIRTLRKSGNMDELLDDTTASELLQIIQSPTYSLVGDNSTSVLLRIRLVLSILESASLNGGRQQSWSTTTLNHVRVILPPLLKIPSQLPTDVGSLALRLCLNLTNNSPNACHQFAEPAVIEQLVTSINGKFKIFLGSVEEEQYASTLDSLILSLGTMINLSEFSDKARAIVAASEGPMLNDLVQSFLTGLERASLADSEEESQINVAYGYLTVLLGNLCQSKDIRDKVRTRVPGKGLNVLITAVEEFIHFHKKVDKDMFDGEEGGDVWANYTQRLQAVVDRLRYTEM